MEQCKLFHKKFIIKLLSKKQAQLNDKPFWEQLWNHAHLNLQETFMIYSSGEIKKIKETNPYNLAALCYKLIEKLFHIHSTYTKDFDSIILNVLNLLICIMPQIYQDEYWVEFFWSDSNKTIVSEIPLPLGKTLLTCLYDLLFLSDFTISSEQDVRNFDVESHKFIWENGIGCSDKAKTYNFDLQRIAVLKIILVCLSYSLYTKYLLSNPELTVDVKHSNDLNHSSQSSKKSYEWEDTTYSGTQLLSPLYSDNAQKSFETVDFENVDLNGNDEVCGVTNDVPDQESFKTSKNSLLDNNNLTPTPQTSFDSFPSHDDEDSNRGIANTHPRSENCLDNPWINYFSDPSGNKHSLAIFTSLLNVVFERGNQKFDVQFNTNHSPIKNIFRWIVNTPPDKDRDELVEVCLHVLLAVLMYDVTQLRIKRSRRLLSRYASSQSLQENVEHVFAIYLARLHEPKDFDFMVKGMVGILNDSLPSFNNDVSRITPEIKSLEDLNAIRFNASDPFLYKPSSPPSVLPFLKSSHRGKVNSADAKNSKSGSLNQNSNSKCFNNLDETCEDGRGIDASLESIYLSINPLFTRGPIKLSQLYQEIMVFLWLTCNVNKKFVGHLMRSNKVLELTIPILFHLNQSKNDVAKMGLMHVGIYVLLCFSAERNFGVRLNNTFPANIYKSAFPFANSTSSSTSRQRFTYADLLIIIAHDIVVRGKGVLSNLHENLVIIVANVSPYLKSISNLAAKCLVHLLDGFSRPAFMFVQPHRYKLTFFLLESLNNIIQYQFDTNSKLIYQIIKRRKIFFKLLNLPTDQTTLDTIRTTTLTNNELNQNLANNDEGLNWRPTHLWAVRLKHRLPLQTILRLLEVLVPQIESNFKNSDRAAYDEDEVIRFLQQGTLVGLLPVPHPILMRRYQPNKSTLLWFMTYVWGLIYLKNMDPPVWYETDVKLFDIKKF